MTSPQFSRPGAIDLSALRKAATTPNQSAATDGGAYSFDVVGEQSLRTDVVERSLTVVVLVSFWSQQVPASLELNATLTKLADEFAGKFLLARLDVGTQPELAEALGIPQVPLVVAALRGQLAPLVQEPVPEAELRSIIEQVIQAAVANGVSGVSEPVGPAAPGDDEPLEPDEPMPLHPAAEAALMSGDFEAATAEYQKVLQATPGDAEAAVGLSRARLLQRTQGVDPVQVRDAATQRPDDVEAQTLAADLDLLSGHVSEAFSRLIELVRRTSEDERDAVRKHLIDLFAVVGDGDPSVGKARQLLASALF